MKKTTRMIIAIVGLVLMIVFTVATVVSLYDAKILNGTIFYIAMAAGFFAVVIYLILMRDTRRKNDQEVLASMQQENEENTVDNAESDKNTNSTENADEKEEKTNTSDGADKE